MVWFLNILKQYLTGDCNDVEQTKVWKSRFVQLRDGKLFVTTSRENKDDQVTISLKRRFLSMPRKKVIVVHGGPSNLLIKCSTEIQTYQWTMALSQYCYIAPTMEGKIVYAYLMQCPVV